MKKVFLLAVIVYFFLAPITFHSDNKAVMQWVSGDYFKVWNIYEYTLNRYGDGFVFHYPPMNFLLAKLEWPIAYLIGGNGYTEWLGQSTESAVYSPNIFRFNLATKTPLILMSLLVGFIIWKLAFQLTRNKDLSAVAACLWLFNPITIYSIPVMGQNDVLAIAFFLMGWLLLSKKTFMAAIFFGLAISIKSYPILWIVFLLSLVPGFALGKRLKILALSLGVYIATIIPFLPSSAYRDHSLNASIGDRFFISSVSLGFDEFIYVIPLVISVYFFSLLYFKRKFATSESMALILLTTTMLFFSFAHFHPQWFLGVVPFWILWTILAPSKDTFIKRIYGSFALLGALFLIIMLYKDKFLSLGLFAPLNPNIVNLSSIFDILTQLKFDPSKYVNLSHTLVASISIFLLIVSFQKQNPHPNFKLNFYNGSRSKSPLWIFLPSGLLLFGFILSEAVPTNSGVLFTSAPIYSIPAETVKTEFTAESDWLKRIEIPMKNPGLQSTDRLVFELSDNQSLIYSLPFTAFNAGDTSLVRFDFPPIPDSKGKNYTVALKNVQRGVVPLEFGFESNQNSNLLMNQFYKWQFNPTQFVLKGWQRFELLIRQLPFWFGSIQLLVILLAVIPEKKKT